MAQAISKPNLSPYNAPDMSPTCHATHTYLPMKMEYSVLRSRHIKFRRRGITQ